MPYPRLWSKKIATNSKVPNHEILGAQHFSWYEKKYREFFQSPKGKRLVTCGALLVVIFNLFIW